MHWQYNPYVLPLLIAAAISAAIAFYAWRRRPAPGATLLALLMLAVAEWTLTYALEVGSPNLQAKHFWAQMQYLGIVTVPVAWLAFVFQYIGRGKWLTRRNMAVLGVEPLLTLLLVQTNDSHKLIWRDTSLIASGLPLCYTHGAGFWVNIAYSYLLLLLGTSLVVQAFIRSPRVYRRQAAALLIGALAPWVGNALYVSGLSPFPHLDLTPFAFTLTGLAAAWGIFRFRLLDIVPVARDAVIESMSDGVMVLDAQNRIVDLNPAAERIIGRPAAEAIGQPVAEVLSGRPDLVERYRDVTEAHDEVVLGEGEAQRCFDLRISPLYDRHGRLTARLVALRDITERKRAEEALRDTVAELTVIHRNVPVVMMVVDRERRVRKVNGMAALFAGRPPDEMLGLYAGEALRCLHHLDDPKGCGFGPSCAACPVRLAVLDTFADRRSRQDVEAWSPFPRGDSVEERCLLVSTAYLQLRDTEQVLVCAQDITERKRARLEIEQRQMYLEGVLNAAPDAIVTLDAQHRVVEWNPGAERLFGYSREEAIGQDIDDLIAGPEVYDEAVEFTQVVTGGLQVPPTETVRYRKDGSPVDVIAAGSPIVVGDELIGTVAVYTDITARVRMEETLRALALLDELTDLYNRRGFFTLGQQQLKAADRAKRRMLLLFADFNGLKRINDAFGHPEGDRALIETADVLRETFRESDIIARIGGDEFVVLAIETNGSPADVLMHRLQENLEARNAREGRRYELSLSVGLARYDPARPCSIDELVTQADRAMYERKRGNQES